MSKNYYLLAQDYDDLVLFDDWFGKLISDFFNFSNKVSHKREYEIIKYRFGLYGVSKLTLEEVGIIFSIERERVRQIEERGLKELSSILNQGVNISRQVRLRVDYFEKLKELRNHLLTQGVILNELTIINQTSFFLSEVNIDLPLLRLLLSLYGYKSFSLDTESANNLNAWAYGNINFKRINSAVHLISKILKEGVIAKTFDEIKLSINRSRSTELRFNDEELNQAIKLSPEFELLDNGKFQIRYDCLSSISDKAYRTLYLNDDAMYLSELSMQLNKEEFIYNEKSNINPHHLGNRLSGDSRFGSMGRSGKWFLTDWKNYYTESILELMEDSLHAEGKPLPSKAIFDYVQIRRPVKKGAITSYLSNEKRFVRVGPEQFALKDWGFKAATGFKKTKNPKVVSKTKLCEYIEQVFQIHKVNEMFVSDLARNVSHLIPQLKPEGLYNSIMNSPSVIINDIMVKKQIRKIAIFVPSFRRQLTKLDILSKDTSISELIQSSVRQVLEKAPGQKLKLAIVRDSVVNEINCPFASVYSAINKMKDIEKSKDASNVVFCQLLHASTNYQGKINLITDKHLGSEIQRALDLVNIDSIDLALFQLGKIFEHTIKRYMLEVQNRNLIVVTKNDLSKLMNMVEWAGKNGVITDENALHFLRIERNARGHGIPPDVDEREALLNNSSILINFFLDYIILFETRRVKL